jgi:antitoxin FitA
MVALQIRHVPDEVRQSLVDQAVAQGQSLQSYLLTLVTREARRPANLALLESFRDRRDGSRLSTAQVIEALDQTRAEREARAGEIASDSS